jgi:hypothetical protein
VTAHHFQIITRSCDSAVVCSRSSASVAMSQRRDETESQLGAGEIVVDRLGYAARSARRVCETRSRSSAYLRLRARPARRCPSTCMFAMASS